MSAFSGKVSSAASGEKVGNFEWIIEARHLLPFIDRRFTGITKSLSEMKALVIGCGTSTLSKDLSDIGISYVLSIDYDPGCIEHMRAEHRDNKSLEWLVYDIVTQSFEGGGSSASSSESDAAQLILADKQFDIIVDKGALDAIIVEGSVASMLFDVRRMLHDGGAYVVCSLHWEEMIGALLRMDSLLLDVQSHRASSTISFVGSNEATSGSDSGNNSKMKPKHSDCEGGTVFICRKKAGDGPVNLFAIEDEEKTILDEFMKTLNPLMTDKIEEEIRLCFEAYLGELKDKHWDDTPIPVPVAFWIVFGDGLYQTDLMPAQAKPKVLPPMVVKGGLVNDYSFELFMEDLSNYFADSDINEISCNNMLELLRDMQ